MLFKPDHYFLEHVTVIWNTDVYVQLITYVQNSPTFEKLYSI